MDQTLNVATSEEALHVLVSRITSVALLIVGLSVRVVPSVPAMRPASKRSAETLVQDPVAHSPDAA